MNGVLLLLGGILGALSRFHGARLIQHAFNRDFPVGTFLVNLSGSFILGTLVAMLAQHPTWPTTQLSVCAGTGFCGAYTTFSSFSVETVQLWRQGQRVSAVCNGLGQPLLGVLVAWGGLVFGTFVS